MTLADVKLWESYRPMSQNGSFRINARTVNSRNNRQFRKRGTSTHAGSRDHLVKKLAFPGFFLTLDFAETVSSPAEHRLADFDDWDRSMDHTAAENLNLLTTDGI